MMRVAETYEDWTKDFPTSSFDHALSMVQGQIYSEVIAEAITTEMCREEKGYHVTRVEMV
jgi:hypothetical protein